MVVFGGSKKKKTKCRSDGMGWVWGVSSSSSLVVVVAGLHRNLMHASSCVMEEKGQGGGKLAHLILYRQKGSRGAILLGYLPAFFRRVGIGYLVLLKKG